MRTLRRAVLLLLVVAAAAAPARAVGPEEELGPELMALADGIVEKVIYGIRYEGLRAERVSAVIRAWTGYYIGEGVIDKRQSAMIHIYVARTASLYRLGVEHVPYAERMGKEGAGEGAE
jgi:hypothetical protein